MPIPGELVAAQYPRIGATGALVTRAFLQAAPSTEALIREVGNLRRFLNEAAGWTPEQLANKRFELKHFLFVISWLWVRLCRKRTAMVRARFC